MAHRHPHERVVETVIVEEVIDDDGDDNYEDDDDDTGAVIEELDEAQSARTRADREGVPLGKDGRPEPPAEEEEQQEDDIDRDDFDPDKETLAERLHALKVRSGECSGAGQRSAHCSTFANGSCTPHPTGCHSGVPTAPGAACCVHGVGRRPHPFQAGRRRRVGRRHVGAGGCDSARHRA